MPYIIVKNKGHNWRQRKDILHRRRKELVEKMKPGMFNVSQMKKGETQFMNHDEQVAAYDKWKNHNEKNTNKKINYGLCSVFGGFNPGRNSFHG